MRKINNIKNKSGFVSLETIIVTGVIIALGLYGLQKYVDTSNLAMNKGIDSLVKGVNFKLDTTVNEWRY